MSVNKGDDNQNQSTPAAQAEGFSERQNSSVSVKGLPRENSQLSEQQKKGGKVSQPVRKQSSRGSNLPANKIKLEEPLQIPERSASKETAVMLPLTKLRKNKRVKEDPEEDVTFSEEDEEEENEEEDSNEDFDEDEDEEDEDDDGDEEASVSAHASGTQKKVRARRCKQKQTSRKLWSKQEDDAIVKLVEEYGTKKWTFVANKLEDKFKIRTRTGKQCRERWHNHLDPYINKTPINKAEEKKIFDLHKKLGNKWADIAKELPGRSDNCIKNYFYSTHRKHQRRINKSLRNVQVGKVLGLSKNLTAEELHKLVIQRKTTYEEIRKMDPIKFLDLEATMRMLYDHGNMKFEINSQELEVIPTTNASMREPKRAQSNLKNKKLTEKTTPVQVTGKRKGRPETVQVKQLQNQQEKQTKRTKQDGGNAGSRCTTSRQITTKKSVIAPKNTSQQVKSQKSGGATYHEATESNNMHTAEINQANGDRKYSEQSQDIYLNQQLSTPVFLEKNENYIDSGDKNENQANKRTKKAQGKEDAAIQKQTNSKVTLEASQKGSPKEQAAPGPVSMTKQPGALQLTHQQSQGCSYKNMGMVLGRVPPLFGFPGPQGYQSHLSYMPRNYPLHAYHHYPAVHGFHQHIDYAALHRYDLAWGSDYDRLKQSQSNFKSGELPPATPDPSTLFKDLGSVGTRPPRNPLLVPMGEKMYNLSMMNSPMFIPFMGEASPRPPTTRAQFQPQSTHQAQAPNALNLTLNVNVNGEYRPTATSQSIHTPQQQQQKPCTHCNKTQCQCGETTMNLDKAEIFNTFQIDGQKSATQTMGQTKLVNFRPSSNYIAMTTQQSMLENDILQPNAQLPSGGGLLQDSSKHLHMMKQNSCNERENKESFIAALNSENKHQSFMTKFQQALPMPPKEVSFAPQLSVGAISGLPSCSTQNKLDSGVIYNNAMQIPNQIFVQKTPLQKLTNNNRSVTPRPQKAVTPVTVAVQEINTPKQVTPMTLQSVMAQEAHSANQEADVVSHKSHSQRSAFKPLAKKTRSGSKDSATAAHQEPASVSISIEQLPQQCVTEQQQIKEGSEAASKKSLQKNLMTLEAKDEAVES